jgi:outer membrane protein TolC
MRQQAIRATFDDRDRRPTEPFREGSPSTMPALRHARPVAAWLLILTVVALAPPLRAADEAPFTGADPDSALQRVLADLPGEAITLEAAVTEALARDTAVAVARAELEAAAGAARREGGIFDPEVYADATRAGDSQPTASFFSGADVLETEATSLGAGARWLLPLGTQLSALLNTERITTNSSFATLSPQIDAYGQLELVQPLLQGFGPGTRGERDAAERELAGAEASYEDTRLATQAQVETLYWALFAAERDYAVQRLIRDQAASFLDEVRLRARSGLVGPAEEANARVFLAEQEQSVLDGEETLDSFSDRLATLLGRRPQGLHGRFRPLDSPGAVELAPIDLDALLNLAYVNNRQVDAARQRVDAVRSRADGARWNARPQLDLVGRLGGRGLAGTGQDIVLDFGDGPPDTLRNPLDSGYGDALEQTFKRDYPSWSVGMRFSLPIGGGSTAGERDRLDAEVVRAEQQLEALRRSLAEEVRAQYRELDRSQRRLAFASEGIDASLEQVRIGTLQFRSGRTTAFELVRLGADLADAQRRYSLALVRTARAAATLRRLTAGAYPGELLAKESTP